MAMPENCRQRLERYLHEQGVAYEFQHDPSVEGESFGIVLLEAMAYGRAVVSSDIAG